MGTTDLTLTADTTLAFTADGWASLDIPPADFELPAGWDWAWGSWS